jgi:hypothetical protein
MKRLVIVISDKCGTGKSTFSRAYADWLRRNVKHAFLQDADGGVGQLLQALGEREKDGRLKPDQNGLIGVQYFSIFEPRQRDAIVDGFDKGAERILVDMPAGTVALLSEIDREIGFFDLARRNGYGVSLVNGITPMLASGRTVGTILEAFGDQPEVGFVVVKNAFFGPEPDDWQLYDGSKGRAALLERGGVELTMPAMRMRTFAAIDEHKLGFTAVASDSRLKTADRSVTFRWLQQMDRQIELAGGLL